HVVACGIRGVDAQPVGPGAAVDRVGAAIRCVDDAVVAVAAIDVVVAGAAIEGVIPRAAVQRVVAAAAVEDIVPGASVDDVAAVTAIDPVVADIGSALSVTIAA